MIGAGAREHALALALSQDPAVTALACAPGNAGTAALAEQPGGDVTDPVAVAELATSWSADLVVIGPEVAIEAGLGDALAEAGIPCFGPTAAAGQLESSKAFTKAFCDRHHLPTSQYRICDDAAAAKAALAHFQPPYVVKADGLAAGKGVVIAADRAAAEAAIDDTFGGWDKAQATHFNDGGKFDQIYGQ